MPARTFLTPAEKRGAEAHNLLSRALSSPVLLVKKGETAVSEGHFRKNGEAARWASAVAGGGASSQQPTPPRQSVTVIQVPVFVIERRPSSKAQQPLFQRLPSSRVRGTRAPDVLTREWRDTRDAFLLKENLPCSWGRTTPSKLFPTKGLASRRFSQAPAAACLSSDGAELLFGEEASLPQRECSSRENAVFQTQAQGIFPQQQKALPEDLDEALRREKHMVLLLPPEFEPEALRSSRGI